jgi:hypothetical protein
MKSENILKKIINRVKLHNNETIKLLYNLQTSIENENLKNNEEMLLKIAGLYNLDKEQLLKRFLKKNKKKNLIEISEDSDLFLTNEELQDINIENSDENDNSDYDEIDNYINTENKKKDLEIKKILKKKTIDNIDYFFEEKNNGNVYIQDETEIKIVGKYNLMDNKIIFI